MLFKTNDYWHSTKPLEPNNLKKLLSGDLCYFPLLNYALSNQEKCISTQPNKSKRKNISYCSATKQLKGFNQSSQTQTLMKELLSRYSQTTFQFLKLFIPQLSKSIIIGRTSLRNHDIENFSPSSQLSDDKLLHVDAFPSTPLGNHRILRVFSNIDTTAARVWNIGPTIDKVLQYKFWNFRNPFPLEREILFLLRLTKTKRAIYDHYMLQLHNSMKLDIEFQNNCQINSFPFPPMTSWMIFTDMRSHAVVSGEYALEQTFYIPCHAINKLGHITQPQQYITNYIKNLTKN